MNTRALNPQLLLRIPRSELPTFVKSFNALCTTDLLIYKQIPSLYHKRRIVSNKKQPKVALQHALYLCHPTSNCFQSVDSAGSAACCHCHSPQLTSPKEDFERKYLSFLPFSLCFFCGILSKIQHSGITSNFWNLLQY